MGFWAIIAAGIAILGIFFSGGGGVLYVLLIALGADNLICSEIVDMSADVDGDGNVDQDITGDGDIDLNDQALYEYKLELFDFCRTIIRWILETAFGTIEVHNADTGQWVVLTQIPEQFDLLELQGKLQSMIYRDNVPPGRYDKLRIDLEKVEIMTSDGKKTEAIMPSKEIIIDTNIVVAGNSRSAVELKIDLIKSLHMAEDEQIIFAPVIDVKSRKNIDVKILNKNKKLVSILGGSLLKSEKFGMDLDGKMRKDFVLDRNVALSVENGKVVTKRAVTTSPAGMPTTVEAPVTQPSVLESTSNKAMESAKATQEEVTAVTIQAKKWLFQPNKILVKKGKVIQLNIIPALGLQFTFALPEYGIEQEITGQTAIKFEADKAGTFKFLCSSCEEFRQMKGALVVEDTATVEITASGFVPQIMTITTGDTVTWANENIADAWPASAVHPTHQAYPGSNINKCGTIEQATIFDACGRLHQDESWSFVFTQPGTWKYHNHLNPTYTGTVIVQ